MNVRGARLLPEAMIRVLFGGPLQTFRSRLLTIFTLYVQYKYMARSDESRFDWDRHNIGHIAKHRVKPEEVEQVLSNNPVFIEMETDVFSGEERIFELGHTNAGRVLFVVWTRRGRRSRPSYSVRCGRSDPSFIHRSAI